MALLVAVAAAANTKMGQAERQAQVGKEMLVAMVAQLALVLGAAALALLVEISAAAAAARAEMALRLQFLEVQ